MGPEFQKLPVVSVVMAPALRWATAGVIRCPYSVSDKATKRGWVFTLGRLFPTLLQMMQHRPCELHLEQAGLSKIAFTYAGAAVHGNIFVLFA